MPSLARQGGRVKDKAVSNYTSKSLAPGKKEGASSTQCGLSLLIHTGV